MRSGSTASFVMVALLLAAFPVSVTGIDLHRMWDDRCFECHGHAGEFVRRSLAAVGGELQGRHHVEDLRRFLHNHYLADSEVDAVYEMLLAQAGSKARFRANCSGCHASAATFVRRSLEFRADVLHGRVSGITVAKFLHHHRDLGPDDAEFYANVLTRVAREVYRQ